VEADVHHPLSIGVSVPSFSPASWPLEDGTPALPPRVVHRMDDRDGVVVISGDNDGYIGSTPRVPVALRLHEDGPRTRPDAPPALTLFNEEFGLGTLQARVCVTRDRRDQRGHRCTLGARCAPRPPCQFFVFNETEKHGR